MFNPLPTGKAEIFDAVHDAIAYNRQERPSYNSLSVLPLIESLSTSPKAEGIGVDDTIFLAAGVLRTPLTKSEVKVTTAEELRIVFDAIHTMCGIPRNPWYVDQEVTHEKDHCKMAQELGFGTINYGFGFFTNNIGAPMGVPSAMIEDPLRPIKRIEYAAIVARPTYPSAGDQALLYRMGYDDLHTTADRIAKYNIQYGANLPVPVIT